MSARRAIMRMVVMSLGMLRLVPQRMTHPPNYLRHPRPQTPRPLLGTRTPGLRRDQATCARERRQHISILVAGDTEHDIRHRLAVVQRIQQRTELVARRLG